jgi:hypothetical protein
MNYAYKCKFCGANGVAVCDDECPPLKIEAWLPLLCCNRCGDYQSWFHQQLGRVAKWSRDWAQKTHKDREERRGDTFRKLESFTKKCAAVMCKHYRVDYTWSDDVVIELLAHPHQSIVVVKAFERSIKRLIYQRPQHDYVSERA